MQRRAARGDLPKMNNKIQYVMSLMLPPHAPVVTHCIADHCLVALP